ncbi:DUF6612 family protein [Alkalicoccobacillus porphyridii]|uniref:Uncharacterized protein n=1 Tax=Alkalicoccobacillus porphyridii TaxID=2597270 RepID=A0A554A3R6_9BACI|nr:DUF6612 family protein [Alkalicoccobacillus porphyridii]TSB48332.1 hypothetical protein FN960_01910 [Alkalicoccobacillus porphyridii]
MKKVKWLTVGLVCTVALVACGNEDASTEEANDTETTESSSPEESTEVDTGDSEETGEEVSNENDAHTILEQSIAAMEDVNSFSMEMNTEQTIEMDGEEPMLTTSSVTMDGVQDPLSFYQLIVSSDPSSGETFEMEQYYVDGVIYMQDPIDDQWMMMSGDVLGMDDLEDLEMSPEDQLDVLMDFAEEITVEDEGDRYALTINGSGDELMELARELANAESDPSMQDDMDQIFEGTEISKLDYVLYINKETYYQEEMHMELEMTMEAEGETITISQVSDSLFSGFNELEEIVVPDDILENAEEISEEEMGAIEGEFEMEEDDQ